jgi:membrane fusion protein, multidrug efflux system
MAGRVVNAVAQRESSMTGKMAGFLWAESEAAQAFITAAPRAVRGRRHPGLRRAGTVLAACLLALGFLGCSDRSGAEARSAGPGRPGGGAPVPVLATQAVCRTVPVDLVTLGNVQAYSTVAVRSRVEGELLRVHFNEGQDVRQGDLLFSIDPRPVEARLRQAEANLARDQARADQARVNFERRKRLYEEKLVARDEYDNAEADLRAMQAAVLADRAAVSNATLDLEFTQIRSPLEGRTGNLLVHAGNLVQANSAALVALNQIRPVYVVFSIPEQHLSQIKSRMGQARLEVQATIPESEASPEQGHLSFVDNAVDTTTGTIQLKATFANDARRLWPGQFVEVRLRLSEWTNAVVVPTPAVQNSQNGEMVFVVKADQTVEMRPVKTSLRQEGETVVTEGLRPGETVVTDGQLRLTPGARVRVAASLMEAAAAPTPTNSQARRPSDQHGGSAP